MHDFLECTHYWNVVIGQASSFEYRDVWANYVYFTLPDLKPWVHALLKCGHWMSLKPWEHTLVTCAYLTYHLSALVTLSAIVLARWASNISTGLSAPKREWVPIMKANTRSCESSSSERTASALPCQCLAIITSLKRLFQKHMPHLRRGFCTTASATKRGSLKVRLTTPSQQKMLANELITSR